MYWIHLLDLGEANGILTRSGAWFSYKGEKLDNGREKTRVILCEDPELALRIENDIRAKLGMDPRPSPAGEAKKKAKTETETATETKPEAKPEATPEVAPSSAPASAAMPVTVPVSKAVLKKASKK